MNYYAEVKRLNHGFKFMYSTPNDGARIDYALRVIHPNPDDIRLPDMASWVRVRGDGKCEYIGKPDDQVEVYTLARITHDPAPTQMITRVEQALRQARQFCKDHPATDEHPQGRGLPKTGKERFNQAVEQVMNDLSLASKDKTCEEIYHHLSQNPPLPEVMGKALVVHILRNPAGWNEEYVRMACNTAADIIEGM